MRICDSRHNHIANWSECKARVSEWVSELKTWLLYYTSALALCGLCGMNKCYYIRVYVENLVNANLININCGSLSSRAACIEEEKKNHTPLDAQTHHWKHETSTNAAGIVGNGEKSKKKKMKEVVWDWTEHIISYQTPYMNKNSLTKWLHCLSKVMCKCAPRRNTQTTW